MDQNMMSQIMSDPEIMQLISNPAVFEKLTAMMQDPSRAAEYMADPDIQRIMAKLGGGGGMPGMSNNTPPATPDEDLGNLVKVSATAQYNYKMKEAMQQQRPVVVNFTMNGCPPCARLKPELIRLSKQHPEVLFLYVNNRHCPEVVEDLGIQGFPTTIFYSTLNQQLKKIDTVVGADVGATESNVNRLLQDIESKKKNSIFQQFSHMPLRESEIVYFKQIQWPKLIEKCQAVLVAGCDATLYAPFTDSTNTLADNYSNHTEMLTQLTDLITFLSNFSTTSMDPIKPSFIKVINILFEWPQDHWSVPLHLFRMGCFHGDFATHIAKGGAKHTYASLIQRVAQQGLEVSAPVNAVLLARGLCSIFDKRILTKTVLTAVDDLLGIISYLCLTFQDNKDVVNSALALLLNTAYMIYLYAPTSPENLEKQKVIVSYQISIISTIIETLPLCIGDAQPDAVYRILVALGTTIFPYFAMAQSSTTAQKSSVKQHFVDIGGSDQLKAWKDTFAGKDNVLQALAEVQKMVNGIQ